MSETSEGGDIPLWLDALIDQRVAYLKERNALLSVPLIEGGITTIMTSLTDPLEDTPLAREFWERACDGCGKYCGDGVNFYTGHAKKLSTGLPIELVITFGFCEECKTTRF